MRGMVEEESGSSMEAEVLVTGEVETGSSMEV